MEQDIVGALVHGQSSKTLENIFAQKYAIFQQFKSLQYTLILRWLSLKQEHTDMDIAFTTVHHPEYIVLKVESKIDS